MNLKDARVWLTGASSGIGEALVPALAAAGARVALTARREDRLRALAAAHSRPGLPFLVLPADVTDREAVRQTARTIEREWGGLDLAIFCAGASSTLTARRFETATFRTLMDVNFFGVLHGIEAALPGMVARRSGRIAAVASLAGYRPAPGYGAYGASKAALIHALDSLRFGVKRFGVGVTVINPGFVRTPMTAVNRFWMPAIMPADRAAAIIVRGLRHDRREIHFPLRLSWTLKVLRILPHPLYEWIVGTFVRRES